MERRGNIVKNKRAMELQMVLYWIIGIIVLAMILGAIYLFTQHGSNAITYLKSKFGIG